MRKDMFAYDGLFFNLRTQLGKIAALPKCKK